MQREVNFTIENSQARLRPTQVADLDFVVATELANQPFIGAWQLAEHVSSLANPDFAHLIIESVSSGQVLGYIILQDLQSADGSIQFRRIAIAEAAKGQGYGRAAVQLLQQLTFQRLGAHRFWLDVKDFNRRAQHLYESAGFRREGVLRECLKTADGYDSLIVMSILEGEYRP